MINNTLYILFSYELLKSEIGESDFVQYLSKSLVNYNKINLKRKEYTSTQFTDILYSSFLSEIAYKGIVNWDDDFFCQLPIDKLKKIKLYFNNNSLFINFFSQFLSSKNMHQMMEFVANEIRIFANEPKVYIFTPINSVQIRNHIINELKKININLCPIFRIDQSLIGGVRILFDEHLIDNSWKLMIESKLLINK